MPAGTSTSISRRVRTRPSPRHCVHGFGTTCPLPSHRKHGAAVTSWPRIDLRIWRTSPLPPHSGQLLGVRAGLAAGAVAAVARSGQVELDGAW